MRRQFLWLPLLVSAVSLVWRRLRRTKARGTASQTARRLQVTLSKSRSRRRGRMAPRRSAFDERARFHGLDKTTDGVVTRAEWNGDGRSFANHDWNHDGVLSGAEMDPGAPRQAPLHAQPLPPRPAAPGPKVHTESDEVLFARRDTNHDQRISRGEWIGDASTFERLDFNKDGWLSPSRSGVGR